MCIALRPQQQPARGLRRDLPTIGRRAYPCGGRRQSPRALQPASGIRVIGIHLQSCRVQACGIGTGSSQLRGGHDGVLRLMGSPEVNFVVSTKLWPCAWVWLACARNPRNFRFSDSAHCAHPRRKGAVGGTARSGYRSRATQHHGPSAQHKVAKSREAPNPTTELLAEGLTAPAESSTAHSCRMPSSATVRSPGRATGGKEPSLHVRVLAWQHAHRSVDPKNRTAWAEN